LSILKTMIKTNNTFNVSIVIPSYGTRYLLEKNLPKVLEAAKNPKNAIGEVIVVDDGSKDDSVAFVRKNFPQVRLIKHKINRGFSAAVNTGARSAKGKYLCLLNDDVTPDENLLVGPLSLFSQNDLLFGVSFHEEGYGWAKGKFVDGYIVHSPGTEVNRPHHTFFVNAGGALYRRDIWMKLGGMDEAVLSPFYWEDVDISYRALKRGYALLWDPRAIVSPNISATIGKLSKKRVQRIQERNHLLFNWKNLTSPRLFRKHLIGVIKRTISHPGYLRIVVMALMRIKPLLKARAKEKKETKISDEAIFAKFS